MMITSPRSSPWIIADIRRVAGEVRSAGGGGFKAA